MDDHIENSGRRCARAQVLIGKGFWKWYFVLKIELGYNNKNWDSVRET